MLSVENRKRKRISKKKSQTVNDEDTNFDIIVKNPKTKPAAPKTLTSSQKNSRKKLKKKLNKLEEKRKQKEEREKTLAALQKHSLSNEEMKLFHSSSGRTNSSQFVKEQCTRHAMIISHRKKNKRDRKLDKIINPKVDESKQESDTENSNGEDEIENEVLSNTSNDIEENDEVNHENDEVNHEKQSILSGEDNASFGKALEKENLQKAKDPEICSTRSDTKTSVLKLSSKRKIISQQAAFLSVERTPEIQEARLQLPILGEEQGIVEAIRQHDVVVIVGATGSGKTTQVPQFLYEAGFTSPGMIGVTEPRRVAAVSTCARVKEELNITDVAYQIRYEGTVTKSTKIKFMTDGILLKELQTDFLLSKYSVLIIDEAHERSVNTDILIGMLSRIVPLRRKKDKPLKLVIMSATLRVADFTQNKTLFPDPPPVIDVGGRQHPVTIHHTKHTKPDYVKEAYRKVCKIHRSLPPGDILVFLTGVQEINRLISLLRKTFPENAKETGSRRSEKVTDNSSVISDKVKLEQYDPYNDTEVDSKIEDNFRDDDVVDNDNDDDNILSSSDEEDDDVVERSSHDLSLPLKALPLYSALPPDQQKLVFTSQSDACRLVVVATNVAETSLTIPGIVYVVDSGKVKTKQYCPVTGMSQFSVTWVSRASAAQRAGRAGRTCPGHCYRLYSPAVMGNVMEEHTEPEILKKPIEGLVLQMKNLNIHRIMNFPFPTPPSLSLLQTAERNLTFLGLLETGKTVTDQEVNKITELGRRCVSLPVAPRYAKLLLLSLRYDILQYAVTIVAALSVGHVFTTTSLPAPFTPRGGPHKLLGDIMVLLSAVGAWEHSGGSMEWSKTYHLRHRALVEIRQLRRQLVNIINSTQPNADVKLDPNFSPPNPKQSEALRKIFAICLGDHIGKLRDKTECRDDTYQTEVVDDPVYINSHSVLHGVHVEYVAFCGLEDKDGRVTMETVIGVEEEWLPELLPNKCKFAEPLDAPSPFYCKKDGIIKCTRGCTYGIRSWVLTPTIQPYPAGMTRFRLFAAAFLEGQIAPCLKYYKAVLLARPDILRKSWATLQPRAEALLKQLVNKDVDSKAKLIAQCKKDEKYLLGAFLQWVPESLHEEVRKTWPPIAA